MKPKSLLEKEGVALRVIPGLALKLAATELPGSARHFATENSNRASSGYGVAWQSGPLAEQLPYGVCWKGRAE